jgi:hypothetical protein
MKKAFAMFWSSFSKKKKINLMFDKHLFFITWNLVCTRNKHDLKCIEGGVRRVFFTHFWLTLFWLCLFCCDHIQYRCYWNDYGQIKICETRMFYCYLLARLFRTKTRAILFAPMSCTRQFNVLAYYLNTLKGINIGLGMQV